MTNLLREELGYNHLVVTDDLEMGAIAKHFEIEDAAVRAFSAGEDMLLICATPETIRRGYTVCWKPRARNKSANDGCRHR